MEYKRNREEKHQWRIGDLSWYEGGDIFSVTVQEYSLFKSEQVPPDGTSGASFFGILTQMKSSLQMSWLVQVCTCLLTSVTVLPLPNIFIIVMLLFLSLTLCFSLPLGDWTPTN